MWETEVNLGHYTSVAIYFVFFSPRKGRLSGTLGGKPQEATYLCVRGAGIPSGHPHTLLFHVGLGDGAQAAVRRWEVFYQPSRVLSLRVPYLTYPSRIPCISKMRICFMLIYCQL